MMAAQQPPTQVPPANNAPIQPAPPLAAMTQTNTNQAPTPYAPPIAPASSPPQPAGPVDNVTVVSPKKGGGIAKKLIFIIILIVLLSAAAFAGFTLLNQDAETVTNTDDQNSEVVGSDALELKLPVASTGGDDLPTATTETPANLANYDNSTYGISFNYPRSWNFTCVACEQVFLDEDNWTVLELSSADYQEDTEGGILAGAKITIKANQTPKSFSASDGYFDSKVNNIEGILTRNPELPNYNFVFDNTTVGVQMEVNWVDVAATDASSIEAQETISSFKTI